MTLATSYDAVGAVTGQVYPSGFAAGHTRDAIDRLTALVDVGASATMASLTYQGISRRQATTNQNGTVTEYAYDGFARVATIDHLLAGGGSLHKMEYLYDRVHNRRMEKNTFHTAWVATLPGNVQAFLNGRQGKADVYAYDGAYRLVDARCDVTVGRLEGPSASAAAGRPSPPVWGARRREVRPPSARVLAAEAGRLGARRARRPTGRSRGMRPGRGARRRGSGGSPAP